MISFLTNAVSLQVRGGSATADIWLQIDGTSFPMDRWNDFALVIADWWCVALTKLMRNEREKEIVDFMDGPYSVELYKSGYNRVQLTAREGAARSHVVATGETALSDLGHEVVFNARKLLERCRDLNWWSPDADTLHANLKVLVAEVTRLASRSN